MDWAFIYLSLHGRISRKLWWTAMAPLVLWHGILFVNITSFLNYVRPDGAAHPFEQGLSLNSKMAVVYVSLLLLHPTWAVLVKRSRDRDKSPWWAFVLYVLFFAFMLLSVTVDRDIRAFASVYSWPFFIALVALMLWLIVDLGLRRGVPYKTKYGPNPVEAYRSTPQVQE